MELYIARRIHHPAAFPATRRGLALLGTEDFPEEGLMRALAGELKHSETAFVRRTGEKSFHIRYFTPAEEVDLCGHATIASFTVLRDTGGHRARRLRPAHPLRRSGDRRGSGRGVDGYGRPSGRAHL